MNLSSLNFHQWIQENRHLLNPPVNNKVIWKDREFIVMIVGGPNERSDYHINEGEEFFYQLEGNMVLKIIDEHGKPQNIAINQGDIFLLPARVPHSPQREKNSIGLVVERKRKEHELDAFAWYCEQCGNQLYQEKVSLSDIMKQLPPIFERFYSESKYHQCNKCNWKFVNK